MRSLFAVLILHSAAAAYNYSTIEELCRNCTEIDGNVFYKFVWQVKQPAEFACRSSPYFNAAYGILGDKACTPIECLGIENRPLAEAISNADCWQNRCQSSNYSTVTLIKDLFEICLIFSITLVVIIRGDWKKVFQLLRKIRTNPQDTISDVYVTAQSTPSSQLRRNYNREEGYDETDALTSVKISNPTISKSFYVQNLEEVQNYYV